MELAADADAEIVTVDGNGNKNGGAGNGLYQVVKMDGDRVVEIEPVDADEELCRHPERCQHLLR